VFSAGVHVKGTATYQREGHEEQILSAGSAFFDPAKSIITNFANASESDPVTFVAF
jgi:hypothetical protein